MNPYEIPQEIRDNLTREELRIKALKLCEKFLEQCGSDASDALLKTVRDALKS